MNCKCGILIEDCAQCCEDYAETQQVTTESAVSLALSHEVGDGSVHFWFELSYAQYLTIPRSVLQSMPHEWQRRFTKCLEELDAAIDWRPAEGQYWVSLKDSRGRYMHDPLMDYERGRRRVPLKKGCSCGAVRERVVNP